MHGLLTDDMAVYKEDGQGNPEYNFMYVDVLFEFLHSIAMMPFVVLGFMPGALADLILFFGGEVNVTPNSFRPCSIQLSDAQNQR